MKVTLITPYWRPIPGGITSYVLQLATELHRAYGIEISVIASGGNPDPGVTIIDAPAREFVTRARAELERLGPDAVHAHGHWYALAAGLRYRAHHPHVPVIFTLHTPFSRRSFWRRYALRLLLSRADFVTGVSAELLAATVRATGFRTRTRVTHPGVFVPEQSQTLSSGQSGRPALDGKRPLIGYVGRLEWEGKARGVAELIRAMKSVRMAFPSATLLIAGDGRHRGELEELAHREVPGGVEFLGEVPNPMDWFYGVLDVYAHISFQEGLPIAVLEAMALGKPVVASRIGGIPEIISDGQNGLLVSGEPLEVASSIIRVLSSPEDALKLVSRAAENLTSEFSWARASERFVPLYGGPISHRVAITVDLERDYGVSALSFRGVNEALPRLLDLFAERDIRATFFATSDLCEEFSHELKGIAAQGHGLGCHGESHSPEYLSAKSYEWQLDSLRRATRSLEKCVGVPPRAFRAPNFSANGDTIRVLEKLGYQYDSSVLPGRLVRRNRTFRVVDSRLAPRDPYTPSREDPAIPGGSDILEIPVAENPFAVGGPIGLGYVNAFGKEKALQAIAHSACNPCVFVVHPWESLDPPGGRPPEWMKKGCKSDLSEFGGFLTRLTREHSVVSLIEI